MPAVHARFTKSGGRTFRTARLITLSSLILFAVAFFGIRQYFGPRPARPNPAMGVEFLVYNIGHYQAWLNLFGTMGILPIMAIVSYSRWPRDLKSLFWLIVPIWFLVHFTASMVDESRLFLVPHVMVFLPGALFGISPPHQARPDDAPLLNQRGSMAPEE
jgi:hypothetical protein